MRKQIGSTAIGSQITPVVSVAMTAYNSGKWLPAALNSVLEQQTSFPFEIVISDDASQDETVNIARSYHDRYPDKIRVLERSVNVGIQRNYYEAFEQCRGKYIAWLDCDDHWTDPVKLEVQVQALESDPSISACFHYVRVVTDDGNVKREKIPFLPPGRYGLRDLLHQNIVPSPSVIFRNGIQRQLPTWYFDLAPITDWPIWVLATLSGDILLLDRTMADYRHTSGSSHSTKGALFAWKMDTKFYDHIESILSPKWRRLVRSEKGKRYEAIASLLQEQGNATASREAAFQAFWSPALIDNLGSKTKTLLVSLVREAQWRLRGKSTTG
jgi:glycosyltransferase involved in cell wall biosynthesis